MDQDERKKIPRNFSLPPEIDALYREMTEGLKERQKWMVVTAAILLLAEFPLDIQRAIEERVSSADFSNRMAFLIQSAKRGDLRYEANSQADKRMPKAAKKQKPE